MAGQPPPVIRLPGAGGAAGLQRNLIQPRVLFPDNGHRNAPVGVPGSAVAPGGVPGPGHLLYHRFLGNAGMPGYGGPGAAGQPLIRQPAVAINRGGPAGAAPPARGSAAAPGGERRRPNARRSRRNRRATRKTRRARRRY